TFYHAKHGASSLGASPFHEAVGQALKNLGNMTLTDDLIARKKATWKRRYVRAKVTTAIPRYVRGSEAKFVDA
ncbi:MAG: hypothetical protein JZU55_05070, partial [Afipia sp.]|nr:hypothetical protein [Afipia sp.]